MSNFVPNTWKPCTDDRINTLYNEVYNEACKQGYEISKPKLYIFKSTVYYGLCRTRKVSEGYRNVIGINDKYLHNEQADVVNTLVHEFAHAIAPGEHHNHRWEYIGNKIGKRFNTTVHRLSNSEQSGVNIQKEKIEYKYATRCKKCGHEYHNQRLCRSVEHPELFRCGYCHGELERIK